MLEEIIGRFAGRVERLFLAKIMIVAREAEDHIAQFADVPHAGDAVGFRHQADVAVGLLRLDRFVDEMLLQGQYPLVFRICRKADSRVDQFAQADVAAAFFPGTKGGEKILVGPEHEQIVIDRHLDPPPNLAAQLNLPQFDRLKHVGGRHPWRQDSAESRQGHRQHAQDSDSCDCLHDSIFRVFVILSVPGVILSVPGVILIAAKNLAQRSAEGASPHRYTKVAARFSVPEGRLKIAQQFHCWEGWSHDPQRESRRDG